MRSMKKYAQSIVYVISLLTAWYVMRLMAASEENPFSIYENPLMWVLFIGTLLIILMKEVLTLTAMSKSMNSTEENKADEIHEEGLPAWLFVSYAVIVVASICFASIPIANFNSPATNTIAINEKVVPAKVKIEASTAQVLTDNASLSKGKAIFNMYCASCHAKDGGGGNGPNLTDEYWIKGGNMESVFNTIQNGGRLGKGMMSWKRSIKPENIEKVASYVLSLQGKKPKNPKPPQGELWETE